ncbi:MAG: FAD-dependent oxidoreductase [bacterium]
MATRHYQYILVGGGLACGAALRGIRERDGSGTILMLGNEAYLPYDRPPLSKKLWLGKTTLEKIFVNKEAFYSDNHIDVELGVEVTGLDAAAKTITDNRGETYSYDKLLLATGGQPKHLPLPGADLPGICYYRYLDDYKTIRNQAKEGSSAMIIGGGFIGSEMAVALNTVGVKVTMIFPETFIVPRVFPEGLALSLMADFRAKGITIITEDVPISFTKAGGRFLTRTKNGQAITTDMLLVGIGISPAQQLAEMAGLATDNGIVVNQYLQSSDPNIYAAGDVANFPYQALGKSMRVEHWDNALSQGEHAGRNMAGADAPFSYMPYFYSDLFDFGYEAVGEVDNRLTIVADWQQENITGVLYYLQDEMVRGVMLCNVWDKLDAARELIKQGEKVTSEQLRGAIK